MEGMGKRMMFLNSYAGKKVLVTGNTGFKGSWLTSWLLELGADVAGYSVDVPSTPSNFEVLGLEKRIRQYWDDVRDRKAIERAIDDFKPDIVFHLAAQAIVRRSYADPAQTFEVNAMGTMNVLECVRHRPWVRACVMITSDKCYRNVEWHWGYRENDALGGEDPYSGSKGCAELISYSYIHSYFKQDDAMAKVATARAGNVIGGGDWAADRIVPDCVRSWSNGETVVIRSPHATRPWQHVLEPLSGYLWLGAQLLNRNAGVSGTSYNFGPDASVNQPVEVLISHIGKYWSGAQWTVDAEAAKQRPEARLLKLSCDKALAELGWRAVLKFEETVRFTSEWYKEYYAGIARDMRALTRSQIQEYEDLAKNRGLPWCS
jgi:CDP-glucose 4,6-dehydratase